MIKKKFANKTKFSLDDSNKKNTCNDKEFLIKLNLSSLLFIIFPLFGFIAPTVLWIIYEKKVNNRKVFIDLINFQITWVVLLLIAYLIFTVSVFNRIENYTDISIATITENLSVMYSIFSFLYLYNLLMVIINTVRIIKDKKVYYLPLIKFLN